MRGPAMTTLSRPSSLFTPTAGCTTTLPNAAHEHLDAETVAEINAWHDEKEKLPTPEEIDRMIVEHRDAFGRIDLADDGGDDRTPPPSSAAFPEILTWADDALVLAIGMADERDPGM